MTFERVYDFAYAGVLVPLLDALANEIGREKFLPMLQEVASRVAAERVRRNAPPPPKNTLAALVPPTDYFWTHVLTSDCIEKTDNRVSRHRVPVGEDVPGGPRVRHWLRHYLPPGLRHGACFQSENPDDPNEDPHAGARLLQPTLGIEA